MLRTVDIIFLSKRKVWKTQQAIKKNKELYNKTKMNMDFTVVVTGAGRGLGHAMVDELADRHRKRVTIGFFGNKDNEKENVNLRIIPVSRTSLSNLSWKEKETQSNGLLTIRPVIGELGTEEGLEKIIGEIRNMGGNIDALVNNAATFEKTSIKEINWKQFSRVYYLNTYVPFRLTAGLLEQMSEGMAHILNIGSMGGIQGAVKYPGFSIYSSSKMALAGLTECLATELPGGIAINYLGLGSVRTEMLRSAFPDFTGGTECERMASYVIDCLFSLPGVQNGSLIRVSNSNP